MQMGRDRNCVVYNKNIFSEKEVKLWLTDLDVETLML